MPPTTAPRKAPQEKPTHDAPYVKVQRPVMFLLALAVLMPWVLLVIVIAGTVRTSTIAPVPKTPEKANFIKCKPGPWGELEYFTIVLQPPAEFVSAASYESTGKVWVFQGYDKDRLTQFLASAGLKESDRTALMSTLETPTSNTCVLKPSKELRLNLNPEVRARIYFALSTNPANAAQYDPFSATESQLDEWLARGQISGQTVSLVKKLLYTQNGAVILADYDLALSSLSSQEEKGRLLRVLLGRPSLILRLRVTAETHIDALAEYWGKAGNEKEIRPVLEGLPKTEHGVTIGVPMLLPPFARQLAYTFPLPSNNTTAQHRDCHWTSLNFFSESTPDDKFTSETNVVSTLKSDYYPVSEPSYGDVGLFLNKEGRLIHSAVYLADDIFFTKNGAGPASPWVLMRLSDLRSTFSSTPPQYYRLKKL